MPAFPSLVHRFLPWACDHLPPSRITQRDTSMMDLFTRKMVPVYSTIAIFFFLYVEYGLHCWRLIGGDKATRGFIELCVFHKLAAGIVYCFLKTVGTFPGTIPESEDWEVRAEPSSLRSRLKETKRDGELRQCKFCFKYKPDRSHHCRHCDICVLRMDHHCHFVMNCIGFYNYKYFFCLTLYTMVALLLIVCNMFETTWWSTRVDVSLSTMILFLSGQTFASFALVLLCCFLVLHVWLMCNALTTVELMEKRSQRSSLDTSMYSNGWYENVCAMLGPKPWFWLLPFSLPDGNGLDWTTAEPAKT